MAIEFKHKAKRTSILYSDIVPGKTDCAANGSTGGRGKNGPCIHFTDYRLDNDITRNTVAGKISRNMVLMMNSSARLTGISYNDGDIIICSDDRCVYRLKRQDEDINFEFLGQIVVERENKNTDENYISNYVKDVKIVNFKSRPMDIRCPSNRGMDSSIDVSAMVPIISIGEFDSYGISTNYKDAHDVVMGFDFLPYIMIDPSDSSSFIDENYEFYLKISIPNEKSPQANIFSIEEPDAKKFTNITVTDPVTENVFNILKFQKYSEIKLRPVKSNSAFPSGTAYKDASIYKCHISDMSLDKLHPSGNNIASNILDSSFKSVNPYGRIHCPGALNITFADESAGVPITMTNWYGRAISKKSWNSNGNKTYAIDSSNFLKQRYNENLGYLQYSKHRFSSGDYYPNFRGGDSAYFSGMTNEMFSKSCFYFIKFSTDDPIANMVKKQVFFANHIPVLTISSKSTYNHFVNHINYTNTHYKKNNRYRDVSVIDSSYDECIKQRQIEENNVVSEEMKSFYFNENNTYELIIVNKKTGRMIERLISKPTIVNSI